MPDEDTSEHDQDQEVEPYLEEVLIPAEYSGIPVEVKIEIHLGDAGLLLRACIPPVVAETLLRPTTLEELQDGVEGRETAISLLKTNHDGCVDLCNALTRALLYCRSHGIRPDMYDFDPMKIITAETPNGHGKVIPIPPSPNPAELPGPDQDCD